MTSLSAPAPPRFGPAVTSRGREAIALARTLHDTVIQRLCGLSLVLGGDWSANDARQQLCRHEVAAALAELRTAIDACVGAETGGRAGTPEEEIRALRGEHPDVVITATGLERAEDLSPPLGAFLEAAVMEALRNVRKHARPQRVDVWLDGDDELLVLTVRNDGVGVDARPGPGTSLGLRLLETEASLLGGTVRAVPGPSATWEFQLVLPVTA